jgi:hypothetical protein
MAKHRRSRKKNEGVGIAQVIFLGGVIAIAIMTFMGAGL